MRGRCVACGRFLPLTELLHALRQPRRGADFHASEAQPVEGAHLLCGECAQGMGQFQRMVRNASALPSSNSPVEAPVAPRANFRWRSPDHRDRSWVYHSLALISASLLPVALLSLLLAFIKQSTPSPDGASNTPEEIVDSPIATRDTPVASTSPIPTSLSPETNEAQPREASAGELRPIRARSVPARPKAPVPTPTRLAVRVSTTTPQRARGFWVTVIVPPAERKTNAQPAVRFQDAKGHRYHLTLRPNGRPGEWTRRFGLDQAGTWRGMAILQRGNRKLSAPLPVLRVLPQAPLRLKRGEEPNSR